MTGENIKPDQKPELTPGETGDNSGETPAGNIQEKVEELEDKVQEDALSEKGNENDSHSDQNLGEQQKAALELIEEKKERAGEIHFVYDNRVFVPIIPNVDIPGIDKRTKLEICADEKAQEFLVKKCIGSVIKEIL